MVQYIYRYDVAAALICVAVMLSYLKENHIKTKTSDAFTALSWQCLVSSSLNVIAIMLSKYIASWNLWFHYIINITYYIFFNAMPLCFYLCMYYLSERNKVMARKQYWSFFGIYLFFSLFTLTTPFTHLVFYFDSNFIFRHGPLFYGYYVLDFIYVFAGIFHFLRHQKLFTTRQTISLMFYLGACMVAAVVQTFFPNLMITGFVFSLTILITFLSLENPDDYYDKETEVYNRAAFKVKAEEAFETGTRMFVIGLYGESVSHILRSIGENNKREFYKTIFSFLKEKAGRSNVFRLTNEKVAILLPADLEEDCNKIVKEIWNFFREPIMCGSVELSISANIKTVIAPDDVSNVQDLIDLIEDSLEGKINLEEGASIRADVKILEKRRRENKIISILEEAMSNNAFDIAYQPIYNIEKASYTSVEALLRLKSQELGDIGPDEFIPLAEKSGLALQIGNFVFKEVCKFIFENKLWEKGIENVHINLSVIQCMQEKLYEHLLEILDYYNLDYKYVNLDVTETTTIAANEILLRNMNALKNHSVYFSLDNYGTGLSNTNTLVRYPFKMVKLDRMLIHSAINDAKARIILHKTVSMIKDLGMEVVAEGVEDYGEYDLVVYLGCNYIQGFMFSNPLAPEEYIKFIAKI
ncbi:MAG: EAL domain-containing protein [Treponema sp.]|nr:EAL domain-containing protein [Treponema sp.]